MKSFFWRYLLTQWAALFLLLAISVGLTNYFAHQRIEALSTQQPTRLVLKALRIAAQEGEEGLKAWVKDTHSQQIALTIYILNTKDEDILNQAVHPRLLYSLKLARQSTQNRDSTENLRQDTTWWQSHVLTLPNGSKLRLVFLPYDNSRWDLLSLHPITIILILLALIITFAFCWLMARYVAWPVEQLGQATRLFAASQLSVRAPPALSLRQDAFGQLAQDFDTMARRIQSQLEIKEQLLRHLAHELRSPLTRLQIAVELASHKDTHLDRQLTRIALEGERLETRLQHILQLARSSELAASCELIDLRELIDEIICDSAYEHKALPIVWQAPDKPVFFYGDRHNLNSALENVTRNALLYAAHAGPIQIRLEQDNSHIHIYVRDAGTSLSTQDIRTMFEPFQRALQHRYQEGSGLGLSITQACIQAHGGSAEAYLLTEKQGFEVHLCLPIVRLSNT